MKVVSINDYVTTKKQRKLNEAQSEREQMMDVAIKLLDQIQGDFHIIVNGDDFQQLTDMNVIGSKVILTTNEDEMPKIVEQKGFLHLKEFIGK